MIHSLWTDCAIVMGCLVGLATTGAAASTDTLELDNGVLRLKVDLARAGGAITYLAPSTSTANLINNHDRGRQVQQSYYAGAPLDRKDEGQSKNWSPWSWNPIQVGDAGGNASFVTSATVAGGEIYTRTIPLLWDMTVAEQAEAVMEQWTRLEGSVVHVRCRLTCRRADDDAWDVVAALHQELPAVYTIADLHRQFTYLGERPWQREALTEISTLTPQPAPCPWTYWGAAAANPGQTEHWAASVNDDLWGVGVFNARAELFAGGLAGNPGGREKDFSTTYLSPIRSIELGRDTVLDWEYDLIVGTLDEIRDYAYAHRPEL